MQTPSSVPKALITTVLVLALLGSVAGRPALAQSITLSPFAIAPNAVGIDFFEPSGDLAVSVNWQDGLPFNLALVGLPGSSVNQFSPLSGATRELKVATQRSSSCAQFPVGTVFTANGNPGEIVRINPDSTIFANPWVTLPDSTNLRGGFHVDIVCDPLGFNGDLLVAEGGGEALISPPSPALPDTGRIWRVNAAGVATLLTTIEDPSGEPVHLEGLITLPNDPRYGPLAGKLVAGDETNGRLCAVDPLPGAATCLDLVHNGASIRPEDVDLIEPDADFFGVEFFQNPFVDTPNKRILTAPAEQFAQFVGELLINVEEPFRIPGFPSGLYIVRWNDASSSLELLPVALNAGSVNSPVQWEHQTFAPRPDAKVEKTPVSATIDAGQDASFRILVTANGPGPSKNVTLGDTVPAGFLITGGADQTDCKIDSGVLTCNFGDLDPGQTAEVIIGRSTSRTECQEGQPSFKISNTAAIEAARDRVLANNESTAETTVNCPDVKVQKSTTTAVVTAGDVVNFTIVVTANTKATDVTLNDTLPGTGGTVWSLLAPVAGCSLDSNVLSCTFPSLAASETRTIQLSATTNTSACSDGQPSFTLDNTATVSTPGDTNAGNNSSSASITVSCPSQGGEGCTPGYWKQRQHFDSWSAPFTPDTQFSAVFEDAFPGKTLVQVLGTGGGGLIALGRHTVAALLNAASAGVDYDLSVTEVVDKFNAVFPGRKGQYERLKNELERFNQQGCPLN